MLFSSITFLTVFLPVTLTAAFLARTSARNAVLLVASLIFYTWGSGGQVWILLAVGSMAWIFGRIVAARTAAHQSTTGIIGIAAVVLLLPLLWFKYAAWFSSNLSSVTSIVGFELETVEARSLPIGISFFTFQALSYVFDVARGAAIEQRKLRDFLLYIALFPQLIAGPIVRYQTIAGQLASRQVTAARVAAGLQRFVFGLAKKIVVADSVGSIANAAFDTPGATTATAWLGAVAYAIQIFFDFSGYSDMAIGLGQMLGFDFPENFMRPYSALSITDFWRRWHITLSEWFRDYVYIPLGGNRVPPWRQYANLVVVFFLTALWHGAAWTFMTWGALHAAVLIIERVTGRGYTDSAPNVLLARVRTAFLVVVFWVFFRADTLSDAGDVITAMFVWKGGWVGPDVAVALTARSVLALVLAVGVFAMPRRPFGLLTDESSPSALRAGARPVVMASTIVLCFALVSTGSLTPFLYFQF